VPGIDSVQDECDWRFECGQVMFDE